jgi:hypothetical protein
MSTNAVEISWILQLPNGRRHLTKHYRANPTTLAPYEAVAQVAIWHFNHNEGGGAFTPLNIHTPQQSRGLACRAMLPFRIHR